MDNFITPSDSLGETHTRPITLSAKDEISKMCLFILNDFEAGKIKTLPINERTLRRASNGESVDDKTVRTIACLHFQTEDFQKLLEVVPETLKTTIENANNKLTHNGSVSYEVARNPELIQLWNLCSGFGCTKSEGEEKFPGIFDTLISILDEHKLVTKSVLRADCWIMSGEMILDREDALNHYENMFKMVRNDLLNPDNGRFIQFSGQMRKSSFQRVKEKMVVFFMENIRAESLSDNKEESLSDFDEEMVKFNFQSSLSDLINSNVEVEDEEY